jgi:hypothetical protein
LVQPPDAAEAISSGIGESFAVVELKGATAAGEYGSGTGAAPEGGTNEGAVGMVDDGTEVVGGPITGGLKTGVGVVGDIKICPRPGDIGVMTPVPGRIVTAGGQTGRGTSVMTCIGTSRVCVTGTRSTICTGTSRYTIWASRRITVRVTGWQVVNC